MKSLLSVVLKIELVPSCCPQAVRADSLAAAAAAGTLTTEGAAASTTEGAAALTTEGAAALTTAEEASMTGVVAATEAAMTVRSGGGVVSAAPLVPQFRRP